MTATGERSAGFIAGLAAELARHPFDDVRLVAPTNRIGRQWLDRAARLNGIVHNVSITAMSRLVRELAGPELESRGLRTPGEPERLAVLAEAFAAERAAVSAGGGYFSALSASLNLLRLFDASFNDLHQAGIAAGARLRATLVHSAKGDELAALFDRYRDGLRARRCADPAVVAECARRALPTVKGPAPFLVAADEFLDDLRGAEETLWREWPEDRKTSIPAAADPPDAARVDVFVADTEHNEAREIFRRILAEGTAFDAVEILVAGGDDALARIVRAATEALSCADPDRRVEDLPLTFVDGLPSGFARPARLLTAWLDWTGTEMSAAGLADIVSSGLLAADAFARRGVSPERTARLLLNLVADPGAAALAGATDRRRALVADPAAFLAFRDLCAAVVAPLAVPHGDPAAVLAAARALIADWGASRGELDAYARERLLEDPMLSGALPPWPGFDAREWLYDLVASMRLMGKGPLPGKIHVAGLSGGHSGRDHLFVMGLDDSVFPGGERQDPVLLDQERARLSDALPLAARGAAVRERRLRRALANARGRVVLSCARFDIGGGRDLFPADILADLIADRKDAPVERAAFASADPDKALSAAEYWVRRLLSFSDAEAVRSSVAESFSFLAAGDQARRARASAVFGAYDGHVPGAGAGEIFSATQLELLARCPQEFFFREVLRITPPPRYEREKGRWLDGRERGNLMHRLFSAFLGEIERNGEKIARSLHQERIVLMLDELLNEWRAQSPPPDAATFERERRDLVETCAIFLHAEEQWQEKARPWRFEASFGMGGDGPFGDRTVELTLAGGKKLGLRGRFDRIDQLRADADGRPASDQFVIWDYKSGRSDRFVPANPFANGNLQAALYAEALDSLFAGTGRRVAASGYFFPSPRDEGRRILYDRADLRPVTDIVADLSGLLAAGAFPFTPNKKYESHDARPIFDAVGGSARLAAQTAAKIASAPPADALAAWSGNRYLFPGKNGTPDA